MHQLVAGMCLCGSVKFTVDLPSIWSSHCHCMMCQRAHGAAMTTWVGFKKETFVLTAGDVELNWYASSPGAERGFCSRCGSTMFFRSERWQEEIHVARANLEEQDLDRQPDAHVFYETHVAWIKIDDDLPQINSEEIG